MICPRCGKEIPDEETLCPFCMQEIDKNMEFNDFREDGFVQIQSKGELNSNEPVSYKPRYFDINEYNIFVIAVIFVLAISLFTVFSLRFVQKRHSSYVPKYVSTEPVTEEETEPTTVPIKNTVKNLSIKNLIGSWKLEEEDDTDYSAIPYFTFSENGYFQENYGSIIVKGSYKNISDKNDPGVYISVNSTIKGAYDFDVKGNKKDGYTLTLTDRETGEISTFENSEAKMKKLGTIKGYHVDNRLLGTWYTKDKKKAYKFVKNGRIKRVSNDVITYGVYTVDRKNTVVIKYIKEEIKTVELDYYLESNGKTLIINDTKYKKQK